MTLAAQMLADVDPVFLNEDDFAERILYRPAGDATRTIVAYVGTQSRKEEQLQRHETDTQFIVIECKRSSTDGMSDPKQGDAVRLDTDPPDAWWDFDQALDSDAAMFRVQFRRRTISRSGLRPSQL